MNEENATEEPAANPTAKESVADAVTEAPSSTKIDESNNVQGTAASVEGSTLKEEPAATETAAESGPPTEPLVETAVTAEEQNVQIAEPSNMPAEVTTPEENAAKADTDGKPPESKEGETAQPHNEETINDEKNEDSAVKAIEEEVVDNDVGDLQADGNKNPKEDVEEKKREKEHQELLEKHKALLERRRQAGELNTQFQTKLVEYFRRKRADAAEQAVGESGGGSSLVDNTVDFNQRYSKYIATLAETRNQFLSMKEVLDTQIAELKETSRVRQNEAATSHEKVVSFVVSHAKKAVSNRTGRPLNIKEYDYFFSLLAKKEKLVTEVRLESIKIQNEVNKVDAIFKSQEDLADGLHLIDFEQLKIENQTYNEKIEERNEEIGKLRRKIANTVQIMTHVKEKLQSCLADNANLTHELSQTDNELNANRDKLTKIKQSRDSLRAVHAKLQRSCGLLGKPELLRNYEACMDAVSAKRERLNELRRETNKYLQRAEKYREKIESFQHSPRMP
ncbi:hypothetical protein AAHC03_01054 [Spirometra sp. Aus1]